MLIPLPPEILTRPATFAATRMLAWSVGSQHQARRNAMVAATACAIFFGFYGSPAIGGDYGDVSAVISILSIFAALPLMLMTTLPMSGLRRMTAA